MRRDLLRLRRKGAELSAPSTASDPVAGSRTDLIRVHRPGMGSFFEIRLGARLPGAVDLANRALDVIEALEAQLTVYRDDSEVSRLNQTAHAGPVAVEPGLFDLIHRALELSELTGGAYDVTSGASRRPGGSSMDPRGFPIRKRSPTPGRGPAGTTCGSTRRPGLSPSIGPASGSTWARSARDTRSTGPWKSFATIGCRSGARPRRPVEPVRAGLSPGPVRRSLGNRRSQSREPRISPGSRSAAEPRAGHLGRRIPAVRRGRPGVRPHP